MKKILSIVMLLMLSVALHAQHNVTKFLGIPVDGTKAAIIQKLKSKGFVYHSTLGHLEGEFNGEKVNIIIGTNNNKVWRIIVVDQTMRDEAQIKTRYNTLCRQFKDNSKYVSLDAEELSESENILHQMVVNNKRYQAAYAQLPIDDADNRVVWFTISQQYGRFQIAIYYENGYNQANGDDL